MAIYTLITPFQANEVPRETSVSRAFLELLHHLYCLIVAERDLEDVSNSHDPAYAAWAHEAEIAHNRLTDALRAFLDMPIELPEDRPLRRMTMLIDAVLGHEDAGGARRLLRQMHIAFFTTFQVPGIGVNALHRKLCCSTHAAW